ncbi:MAG: twitching motility protein [Aquificaceae bacterium]|nr:twitching motility protein [Aquificaceae bacterium]MDW8097092.1 twitching motility protein [Aquificaceae bacterium]
MGSKMNYTPQIINYLGSREGINELYMVPGAFIMEKRVNKLVKVSNAVLTQEDIRDTLVALRSYASPAFGPLGREGMFSFGVKGIGRFRVKYATQRGSYMVHIVRTPYQIPFLERLCQDRSLISKLEEIVRLQNSGLIVFYGRRQIVVSTFIYSLLQDVSQKYSKVIFILESPLNFLLKHSRSLVIQREVGVDTETFEEALRDALHMNPDILYMGQRDAIPAKEQEQILNLVDSNTLVFLSMPHKHLTEDFREYLRAWVEVDITEEGIIHSTIKHTEPQAEGSR